MRPILSSLLLGLTALCEARLKYVGVAISGIDFDCDIQGTCPFSDVQVPLKSLGGADSAGQMQHFVDDDNVNIFRLPTTWQFLLAGRTVGKLDSDRLQNYEDLVSACLATGAYCMLEIHNFAHFEGKIIGQGGPSNADFANLWSILATKYKDEDKVIFELMNEPHDLDIGLWADTCQAAVTAIRKAGANQMILLPGTNFASAATITSDGSADKLFAITNPDGSYDNLVLDVHKYLDTSNSGTEKECTTDNVGNFTKVADYLRENKRTALISETGASSSDSCLTAFKAQNEYIADNDDVFLGYVAWAAGGFDQTYLLSLTPTLVNGKYVNNKVMSDCVLAPWGNAPTTTSSSTKTKTTSSSSSSTKATTTTASSSSSSSTTSATSTAITSLPENAGSSLSSPTPSQNAGPGSRGLAASGAVCGLLFGGLSSAVLLLSSAAILLY